jgi:hypothetical protein
VILESLPSAAAWRHVGLREGFEVAFFDGFHDGYVVRGHTTAVQEDQPWAVLYEITLGQDWLTRTASVSGWSAESVSKLQIMCDSSGCWSINGMNRPDLDGCLDLDLESSAVTNTIPVHRLALSVGSSADAPAAYVRAGDLQVERLEQRYERRAENNGYDYDYEAPQFDFQCRLSYDFSALITSYPGIAIRAL